MQLSKARNRFATLAGEQKSNVRVIVERALESLTNGVKQLGINEQQILILEVAQLGAVFISEEWRDYCPPVPHQLLNDLLDSLVANIRKLQGHQVGMMIYSFNKLHLRDPDVYDRVIKVVEEQLDSPGRNTWYRTTESLGKILSGIVLGHIVRLQPLCA